MSHLVGATVRIPGYAWRPQQASPSTAVVLHFARPTRGYPEGRIRILCDDGTDTWWDVSKLDPGWVTALADPASLPGQHLTPIRGGRRAAASTPGTAGRGRGRRRASRAGDGYGNSGGDILSDGELAPLRSPRRKLLSPPRPTLAVVTATAEEAHTAGNNEAMGDAAPESVTAGLRTRGRPRRSLRFAPGTVSPGARDTARASLLNGDPTGISAKAHSITPIQFGSPLTSPRSSEGGQAARAAAEEVLNKPSYSSVPPRLSWERRLRNILLVFLVTLPAIYFYRQLHFSCREEQCTRPLTAVWTGSMKVVTTSDFWCALGYQEPLLAVNLVFLLNVGILFWFISLLQGSTWLIDPFWTVIPVLIGIFYQHHPAATSQPLRSRLAMGLLWIWSVRLTHSYFRREEWQVGAREDWRYARMAQHMGRAWWVVSFFAVGITQQLMLVGITLPLLAIHTSVAPWNPTVDVAIFLSAATGMMIALIADNQLRDFMVENEKRVQEGRPRLLLLSTGLWRYSRHPNFFGEQLWWWSLGMWAVLCGQPWMLVGPAFNTLCLIPITRMTEERMLERPERASLYRNYQRSTSVWIPWPKRAVTS